MKVIPLRLNRRASLTLLMMFAVFTSSCASLTLPRDAENTEACEECKDKARVCKNPTVMALAHDIDELEEHIDKYGSVVAKQPDVWGQARLTQHREDVEKYLAAELGKFTDTLQGALSRDDQAFLGQSLALGIAASGAQAGLLPPRAVVVNTSTSSTVNPTPLAAPTVTPPALIALTGNKPLAPLSILPATTTISLEPIAHLDQLNAYLQHLNQLRRNNEGDDTADSPGYSLNLVRMPVSVLPGKTTEKGHGAEVSMTLTPYLSDELLPTTFRNLVMNDLLDQLGLPLTEVLNDCDVQQQLKTALTGEPGPQAPPTDPKLMPNADLKPTPTPTADTKSKPTAPDMVNTGAPITSANEARKTAARTLTEAPQMFLAAMLRHQVVPATKLRQGRLPFPPSQMHEIYGEDLPPLAVVEAYEVFSGSLAAKPVVHYPDVQSYLQEEINAAYKLLAEPDNQYLWGYCTPQLAEDVRTHKVHDLENTRKEFLVKINYNDDKIEHKTSLGLTWAIIVESALLNEQLVNDMRETAAAKACGCAPQGWQPFYLPTPPPEARQAFNEYVRCRWPIHVFALDPVTQQQNIADQFSSRRDMELALSLAFVSGKINANSLTQYTRHLELDTDTIALNSTAVGFSHGDSTFGWRFYPRYQTPDIESNATVIFRDMLIGGPNKDQLMRERRLEPGMRECAAIVIMPSFVPYASLEVSSNWFALTDPKCKKLTTAEAMRLGRAVKAIQKCGPQVGDADCYRDGDLARLQNKAQQLDARLPFQSTMVQVPYENTLGGFSMFNNGVTDLAPELNGWYGATFINSDAPTILFLVGNHYSVHETKVIAGGVEISDHEMLSRQVMKVTIPAGAQTVSGSVLDPTGKTCSGTAFYVDVHLATPYGVTSHLFIPAITTKAAKPDPALSWGKNNQVDLAYVFSGVGITASNPPTSRPAVLTVTGKDSILKGDASLTLMFDDDVGIALPTPVTFDKSGVAKVQGSDLAAVFAKYGPAFGPQQTNPPRAVSVTNVIVQPLILDATTKTFSNRGDAKKLSTDLTINWVLAPR